MSIATIFVHPQLVLLGLLPVSAHHSAEQVLLDEEVLVNSCLLLEQLHNKKSGAMNPSNINTSFLVQLQACPLRLE